MQPVEELRYLMLAVQREGNRTLTEALRPLDLTPSQAEVFLSVPLSLGPTGIYGSNFTLTAFGPLGPISTSNTTLLFSLIWLSSPLACTNMLSCVC